MKKVNSNPKNIKTVYLQMILMPSGEMISLGKTIGQLKDFKGFVFESSRGNKLDDWKEGIAEYE